VNAAFVKLTDPDHGAAIYLRVDLIELVFEVPAREPVTARRPNLYGQPHGQPETTPGNPRQGMIRLRGGGNLATKEPPEEIFARLQSIYEEDDPDTVEAIARLIEEGRP
jgi:hypothetical protein